MSGRRTGPGARWLAWLLPLVLLLAGLGGAALAQEAAGQRAVPPLLSHLTDQAAALTEPQKAALEAKLAAIERETGAQIAVLLVPSTQGEDIAAFAHRVADQWKIGRAGVGDGLLLVAAMQDRRVRIEVAKTLEGAIPDLTARRVIDEAIRPAFRAGDVAGGLNAAIDRLAGLVRGEALPPPTAPASRGEPGWQWEDAVVFLFIAVFVVGRVLRALFGRGGGALLGGAAAGGLAWWFSASLVAALLAGVVTTALIALSGLGALLQAAGGRRHGRWGDGSWGGWTSGGWGGGSSGGGGFGGGGFSSGGGGDFGGGGASGDW